MLNKWKGRLETAFGRVISTITHGRANPSPQSTRHLQVVPTHRQPLAVDGFSRAERIHAQAHTANRTSSSL